MTTSQASKPTDTSTQVAVVRPMNVQVAPASKASTTSYKQAGLPGGGAALQPMYVQVSPGSGAEVDARARQLPEGAELHAGAIAPGLHPTPGQDLIYHGGKTIRHLVFTNFYVGGQAS